MREKLPVTNVPRSTFLEFLERLRARSVEHTSSADELISVVLIAVRLYIMTHVVFGNAGVGRTIFWLFRA